MTYYLRTEVGPEGIADFKGEPYRVNERGEASDLSNFDAQFLQRHAFAKWPEFVWEIESVGDNKFIVKGDPPGKLRR
jgi:hypothetical protein